MTGEVAEAMTGNFCAVVARCAARTTVNNDVWVGHGVTVLAAVTVAAKDAAPEAGC
jgi:acetyltransferase-like isoleucine patch superfamily enzyme